MLVLQRYRLPFEFRHVSRVLNILYSHLNRTHVHECFNGHGCDDDDHGDHGVHGAHDDHGGHGDHDDHGGHGDHVRHGDYGDNYEHLVL